jgi:hypothetical protein
VWPKWSATASKCETLSPNPNHTKKKRKKEKKRGAKSKANQPEGLVMKALGKLKRTEWKESHFLFPRCLSYSRASAGKEGTFKLIQDKVSANPKRWTFGSRREGPSSGRKPSDWDRILQDLLPSGGCRSKWRLVLGQPTDWVEEEQSGEEGSEHSCASQPCSSVMSIQIIWGSESQRLYSVQIGWGSF